MLGLWLAEGASVVHVAPWSPNAAPLCSTLGWHALEGRHWDNDRQRMVYVTTKGREVLSDLLQGAPPELRVCARCRRRWVWMADVLDTEVRARG
jgi:hypothetical protein